MAKAEKKAKRPLRKPTVKVKSSSYQPSKAELEADMSINATPRQLAQAVLTTVVVEEIKEPRGA